MNHLFYWLDGQESVSDDVLQAVRAALGESAGECTVWLPAREEDRGAGSGFAGVAFYEGNTCAEALSHVLQAARGGLLYTVDGKTLPCPGSFASLARSFGKDPLTIMAVPRGNRNGTGTVWGLDGCPQESFETAVTGLAGHLRETIYLPVVFAPCVCVKTAFLTESRMAAEIRKLGALPLPAVVEVLFQKANVYGFNAVLVRDAFVYRREEKNPGDLGALAAAVEAYSPGTVESLDRWEASEECRSEKLMSSLARWDGKCPVLIDGSDFRGMYNGTTMAAMRFLRQAVQTWPERYDFRVMMSEEAFSFFGLASMPRVVRVDPRKLGSVYPAVIRFGQVFSWESMKRLTVAAPVIGVFMYDCIAADSNYLANTFDKRVWHYVCQFTDLVYCISDFTKNRILERFCGGRGTQFPVTRLSMDIRDYGDGGADKEDYIFIVGNNYRHKFVGETVSAIAKALPNQKMIVTANLENPPASVEPIGSGNRSQADFDNLFKKAKCVVYPSLYEGFGFPIFETIAADTVLYVREGELNRELYPFIEYRNNVIFYRDTEDLIEKLKAGVPAFERQSNEQAEKAGHVRFANEVLEGLESALAGIHQDRVIERLLWFPQTTQTEKFSLSKYLKYNLLRKVTFGKRREHYEEKFAKLTGK